MTPESWRSEAVVGAAMETPAELPASLQGFG